MLYGIDVHPQFQAGLNIEQVRAEGFDFMAVKVSEATDTYPSQAWLRRGKACGLLSLGYHYLRPGNEIAQAQVFAEQLREADVPGMLDAEALAADGKTPTLTVIGIHRFLDAVAFRGPRVPLLYLPRWYWERMGSPDLSGLPMLWGSGYVVGTGYAADLYQAVTPRSWAAYGGLPVKVLQFTDRALVAGQRIDANAFLGTRDELVTLLSASRVIPSTPRENDVQNFRVQGTGILPLICPTGKPSAITAQAWVSAVVDGPGPGHVRFWFQDDSRGLSDVARDIAFADGHSARQWVQVPDGTTMIRVEHTFTAGGTVCLETQGK